MNPTEEQLDMMRRRADQVQVLLKLLDTSITNHVNTEVTRKTPPTCDVLLRKLNKAAVALIGIEADLRDEPVDIETALWVIHSRTGYSASLISDDIKNIMGEKDESGQNGISGNVR